ncbi:MAG: metal ABC transporter substrate-binding protein [Clostridia bacterium]
MKKFTAILTAILMVTALMTACSSTTQSSTSSSQTSSESSSSQTDSEEKIKIVTTIFPVYDWVKSILGDEIDNVELTMLLETGVDLHSYEPTTTDIVTILDSDLFIYIGGESDTWVADIMQNNDTEDINVVSLFDILGDDVKAEELVDGMEHEHEEEEETDEEEHDHDDEEETDEEEHDHDDEEEESDEHVWLSLVNAEKICYAITELLGEIDSENATVYTENNDAYVAQLDALNTQFEETVESSTVNTLLFADRFPFRYFVDDYDLEYFAAFAGCSTETEASFDTIIFLAEKVNELDLSYVLVIDGSDCTIADTVVSSTTDQDQEILTLNSMQSTTIQDVENGDTYLSVMEENLVVLQQALS